ncbi:hypothetical protein FB451DRAFT_1570469 [Mycena latifolia]|nr:hypothetical protein FB451DRAFT_1570469 [Mycena latifolia]
MTASSRDLPPSQPARKTWTCTKTLDVYQLPPSLLCRLPVCDPASRSPFSPRIRCPVVPPVPTSTSHPLAPRHYQDRASPDVLIPPIPHARFGFLSLTCPRTLLSPTVRLPAPLFEDLPNPATTRGNFVHNINGSPAALSQDLFGAMSTRPASLGTHSDGALARGAPLAPLFCTTCTSVYAAGLSAAGVTRRGRSGQGFASAHEGTRIDALKGYAVHVPPSASLTLGAKAGACGHHMRNTHVTTHVFGMR